MIRALATIGLLLCVIISTPSNGQSSKSEKPNQAKPPAVKPVDITSNFPNKRAIIIQECPFVSLSDFSFETRYERYAQRKIASLSWTNTGEKSIVAFEIVILEYDPFNRQIQATRNLIPGNNSADYRPLEPGKKNNDGFLDRARYVLTMISYVSAVRMSDGTVWFANQGAVVEKIKSALPELTEVGNVDPPLNPNNNAGSNDTEKPK